jgi:hypothetical protein
MVESEIRSMALAIARENGWPWFEPVQIKKRTRLFRAALWTIWTNSDKRGANVIIEIDDASGTVIKARFARR